MTWWPLLLGWPALAVSAVMTGVGLLRRNEYLVLGAIVPIVPFGFYLLGSPVFWWLPVVVVCALLLVSGFVRRARGKGR